MADIKYYTEEELIAMKESGKIGWLDYVNHFSPEWQQEYEDYCLDHELAICEKSAEQFVLFKDGQLESAMVDGDA